MALKLITPPAAELITLEEAKQFTRVDDANQDDVLRGLVKVAQSHLMAELNRSFLPTIWELVLDAFPSDAIQLPMAPVRGVESLRYYDENGDEQTLSPSVYYVDGDNEPGWVVPLVDNPWPSVLNAANAVRVRFTAGYEPIPNGSGSDGDDERGNIPPDILLAAKILVSHWYEHREPVVTGTIVADLPLSVKSLIHPYKVFL